VLVVGGAATWWAGHAGSWYRMNIIFKKLSEKNLKMYKINVCAKTPETLEAK
jgi:hypothetical protein